MTSTIDQRMTVEMDSDFVVFLIGIRINKWWKLREIPTVLSMPRMLKELDDHSEAGCLGHSGVGQTIVQYWRSLAAYARAKDKQHWPVESTSIVRVGEAEATSAYGMNHQAGRIRGNLQRNAALWSGESGKVGASNRKSR